MDAMCGAKHRIPKGNALIVFIFVRKSEGSVYRRTIRFLLRLWVKNGVAVSSQIGNIKHMLSERYLPMMAA